MGDFRASIKIEFSLGDHSAKNEWWINWSPNDEGVDRRVIEWLSDQGDIGIAKIRQEIFDSQEKERTRVQEEKDRAEYERLKQKFDAPPHTQD